MEVHDATESRCQVLWVHMSIFLGRGSILSLETQSSVWSQNEEATLHCTRLSVRAVTA